MNGRVFYVGSTREVAHHARPLQTFLDVIVIEPHEVVAVARPGDVAIFFSEHFDRFRSACVALKQKHIATLYAIDGILEWRNAWENRDDEIACPWTMRPCLSHVVATIGPRQTAILQSWGNNACLPIGLPRLDALTPIGWNEHERLPRNEKFRVLVLTAKCPGFTEAQVETTFRSLLAFRQIVERHPTIEGREIEIVWRLTGGLDERLGVGVNSLDPLAIPEASGLAELLAHVDAVVATPSTAQLEAMLLERPVATLDFHNTPIYADTVFRISAPEHVRPVLEQLIRYSNSPAHQGMQKFLLHENLLADGQATNRMVKLLQWMQRKSLAASESAGLLEFNVLEIMEQLPFPTAQPFDLFWQLRNQRVIGNVPDESERKQDPATGGTMSLAQWQAYTEQLERENRRMSRLVSEAHQVFDNLHGHPVWGSLLKSHEWWSRLWQGGPGKLSKPDSWKEP
jgi:hypothetical protein